MNQSSRVLVSGGAGFVGSHLTERLLKDGARVAVIDNFSSGRRGNLRTVVGHPSLKILKVDLKETRGLKRIVEGCDTIFHFAANPEVRVGTTNPRVLFEENILSTFNLLEAARRCRGQRTFVFPSTSTVYGDASLVPTPEDYAPLFPLSTYGASKLACEALISSYANTFNIKALILRFANIVGARSHHGVISDFIRKIRSNPNRLEVLGDGTQEKSYMHIEDCITATMHLVDNFSSSKRKVDVFNVGSVDKITVAEIAKIVAETMGKHDIKLRYTGGVDGGRGWNGDVKIMQLSLKKLQETGWKPRYSSKEAIRLAARELM